MKKLLWLLVIAFGLGLVGLLIDRVGLTTPDHQASAFRACQQFIEKGLSEESKAAPSDPQESASATSTS